MSNKIIAAVIGGLLTATAWAGGPVFIDGTAANVEGYVDNEGNHEGWLYMQKVLEAVADQVRPSFVKKVVTLGTLPNSTARRAINSAFALSLLPAKGWTIQHVNPEAVGTFLLSIDGDNTGILYIPTANLAQGDLTDAVLTIIAANSANLTPFIENGGGLFAMGEVTTTIEPYSWLTAKVPGFTSTYVGRSQTPLTMTTAGTTSYPTLTTAELTTGPWRNFFGGNLGRLQVLATAEYEGIRQPLIVGGAGTSFEPIPIIEKCLPVTRPAAQGACITRNALFWFTHPDVTNQACVSLVNAMKANGDSVCLGFLKMPVNFQNSDNVKDAYDLVMEAEGLYKLRYGFTGEINGKQDLKLLGSSLCKARKKLAVELIAAIANNVLLGTSPANCAGLPADLIDQAGAAAAGENVPLIKEMTKLLKRFNSSGMAAELPFGLQQCTAFSSKELKQIASDPTTQYSCPGPNDMCEKAQAVIFKDSTDIFAPAVFKATVNTSLSSNFFGQVKCGSIGRYAVWKIEPDLATVNRQFTVDTFKSSYDTVMAIFRGTCSNGLEFVACDDDFPEHPPQSLVRFKTSGTNTYFIVVGSPLDGSGGIRVQVVSP